MKKTLSVGFLSILVLFSGCSLVQDETPKHSSAQKEVEAQNENPLQDKPSPKASFETSLELQTASNELRAGTSFDVMIMLSDAEEPVTTAETTLTFDPELLEVVEVNLSESVLPLTFRNAYDNDRGTVTLSQSNSSGVEGDNIALGKITFKVLKTGNTNIAFDMNDTTVLLRNNADVTPSESDVPSLDLILSE